MCQCASVFDFFPVDSFALLLLLHCICCVHTKENMLCLAGSSLCLSDLIYMVLTCEYSVLLFNCFNVGWIRWSICPHSIKWGKWKRAKWLCFYESYFYMATKWIANILNEWTSVEFEASYERCKYHGLSNFISLKWKIENIELLLLKTLDFLYLSLSLSAYLSARSFSTVPECVEGGDALTTFHNDL